MRIFLTGATGFVGSHVLARALRAGLEVRALRRESSPTLAIGLPQQPQWCTGSLQTIIAPDLDGIDSIIHLASVGVSPRTASWQERIEVNLMGSINLMEVAAAAGVRRVVVAGTCHEYGRSADNYLAIPPDAPLMPANSYGASKAAAFQLLQGFARENHTELFYGRIFTAYGEGQHHSNFWPSLRKAAINGEDFPMTSGRQISDFIDIERVAEYLVNGCLRTDIVPGIPRVVNIATGVGCSLLEFAQREWRRFQASGKLLPNALPDRTDQVYRYIADLRGLHNQELHQPIVT